jgi:riboflavin biosynthesis pyrimidine reductase
MLQRASTCERVHHFRRHVLPARQHDRSRSAPRSISRDVGEPRAPAAAVALRRSALYRLLRMGNAAYPDLPSHAPAKLTSLLPATGVLSVQEVADRLDLSGAPSERPARPYVLLNMISSADGRASIGGRSRQLGKTADRALFHALRGVVDAVMAGAGTVRTERYGRIVAQESARQLRRRRGLSEEPLACIFSERLALDCELPLLATPQAHVAIITSSEASLPACAARVEYIRCMRDGLLDLPAALAALRERFGVRTLLCEGGPHLNSHLFAAGLVDELFLTVAPMLAGADPADGEALRILAGPALEQPVELELRAVLESESQLFLRYGVRAPERVSRAELVSRETTSSTSLAS